MRGIYSRLCLEHCVCAVIIACCICSDVFGQPRIGSRRSESRSLPPPPPCLADAGVAVNLKTLGIPVAGFGVQIDASPSKILVTNDRCHTTGLPLRSFKWELVASPPGSKATLSGTDGLRPELFLDAPGDYRIRFTGCPSGCVALDRSVEPTPGELTVTALSEMILQPETVPALPVSATTADQPTNSPSREKCSGGVNILAPGAEWVTVNQFNGPQDYQTVEGWVPWSRVSASDNGVTNHNSHDVDFFLVPDPKFIHVLGNLQAKIEVEWERNELREFNWPSVGDRVSVFGYWVHDCGHAPFDTEIHPPVGIVVHRARPVFIPADRQFPFFQSSCPEPPCLPLQSTLGTNVFVPGIVSDIFFNRHGGDMKEGCGITTLHQPATAPLLGQTPIPTPCIGGVSSLNRVFEFNIYLPRDPRVAHLKLNHIVPPLAIYHEVLPGDGPEPQIREQREGDTVFLHVSLDLTQFTGDVYARRIVASWVLPSPDNWGLQTWRVSVSSLTIHDSGDATGDADWRLWINTNNTNQEWTRVLDCESCINEGRVTESQLLRRAPWETGPNGVLGPDIFLFPDQVIQVHASAYETDILEDDDRGMLTDTHPQHSGIFNTRSCCDDDSAFTLNYSIAPGTSSPKPNLTQAAQNLFDNYRIIGPRSNQVPPLASSPVLNAISDLVLTPDAPPLDLSKTITFRKKETEGFQSLLESGELVAVARAAAARTDQKAAFDESLNELSSNFTAGLTSSFRKDYVTSLPGILSKLKQALPPDQYASRFGGVGAVLNISGDVDGDGVVDKDDLKRLDQAISGVRLLTPAEALRADIGGTCGNSDTASLMKKRAVLTAFLQQSTLATRVPDRRIGAPPLRIVDPCHSGLLLGMPIIK
jgi:hypothetical protein